MGVNRLLFPDAVAISSDEREFAFIVEGISSLLFRRQTSQNDKKVPRVSKSHHEYGKITLNQSANNTSRF